MTPAMQAARDRVVEAAKQWREESRGSVPKWCAAVCELDAKIKYLLALEAQEKEQADAEV